MIVNKWNFKTKEYEQVTIPKEYHVSTYEGSLDAKVVCPSCLKEITFGDSFTSIKYHDLLGFGYCVCEKCYNNEMAERMLSE